MPVETSKVIGIESFRTITTDSRNASPSIVQDSTPITLVTTSRTRNSLPNWRDKVRRNQDASLPYSLTTGKCLTIGGVMQVSGTTGQKFSYRIDTSGRYKLYGVPRFPNDTTDSETRNRALKKMKDQLAGRTGSAHAMAPLAEARELSALVRQAAMLSTNFAVACLEAKRTKGRSWVRYMQDTWLGYNFALAPMIGDISNIGNAIASYIARQDSDVRLRATATKRGLYTYDPSTSVTSTPIGFALYKKGSGTYELSYRFVGGFELALASANDYSLLDQLGIGFSAIPSTLWELTAFSWLFDYFTNVGEFLDDVFTSSPANTIYLVENRMLRCRCTHSFEFSAKGNPNGIIPIESPMQHRQFELMQFQRTPLAALPHATLVVKHQDSVARNSVSKLLNLLSVLKL